MGTRQVELNRRNIDALVGSDKHQNKRLDDLEQTVQKQARMILTLGNQLTASQQSMAQAAATMGTGPTER